MPSVSYCDVQSFHIIMKICAVEMLITYFSTIIIQLELFCPGWMQVMVLRLEQQWEPQVVLWEGSEHVGGLVGEDIHI